MQRPRATFANVVSSLALFVALGGTGYAAVSLPRNSVGARQIRPTDRQQQDQEGRAAQERVQAGAAAPRTAWQARCRRSGGPAGRELYARDDAALRADRVRRLRRVRLRGRLCRRSRRLPYPARSGHPCRERPLHRIPAVHAGVPRLQAGRGGPALRLPDECDQRDRRRRLRDRWDDRRGLVERRLPDLLHGAGRGPANSFGEWAVTAP